MPERWEPIAGHEGMYEVSDLGNVRSLDRIITYSDGRVYKTPGRMLRPGVSKVGYKVVSLSRNGKPKIHYVHRLVLEAFTGPAPVGQECRHMDGDAMNNAHSNLQWGTRYENIHDQIRHGTHNKFRYVKHRKEAA